VAGGVVLVREAGGVVSNVDGSAFDPYTPDGLASNGPLHPALLEAMRTGPGG
jgi:myo-inositol-1(or 4)-monophosphatase